MKIRLPLLLIASLCVAPVHADTDQLAPRRGSVMTVRGTGSHEQKPDFARLDIVVPTKGSTLSAAVETHTERATRALTALKALEASGLRVESSTFRVTEEKRPAYRSPDVPGPAPTVSKTPFVAETRFSVKVTALDELNSIVTKLAVTNLFEFRKVAFLIDKERAALNAARRAAMTDAREQAETYAEAGDVRLVEITDVTDGEARAADGMADLASPRFVHIIPPAEVSFEASVNVTWRIAPR